MKKIKRLTIDRKYWLWGDDAKGASCLLRKSDGKMCCLGFFCIAVGLTKTDIREVDYPYEVTGVGAPLMPYRLVHELVDLNDAPDCRLAATDRERQIAEKFATIGIKVKYIGRSQ